MVDKHIILLYSAVTEDYNGACIFALRLLEAEKKFGAAILFKDGEQDLQ